MIADLYKLRTELDLITHKIKEMLIEHRLLKDEPTMEILEKAMIEVTKANGLIAQSIILEEAKE